MNANDVRLFIEVTTHQAEEAFKRQMEESNRRIEMHMTATRIRVKGTPRPEIHPQPRGLWWSQPQGGRTLSRPARFVKEGISE